MRSPTTRQAVAGVVGGVLILFVALSGLAAYQGSRRGFLQRKGHIIVSELRSAGEDSFSFVWRLTLRSSTGLDVNALLRLPRQPRPPYPAAVLLGGAGAGSQVVIAPGLESVVRQAIIVSPDYPPDPRRRSWNRINRGAALDTVAQIMLLLDYLESRPDVERRRLFLVGASMGALAVIVAGGVDPRSTAVVALLGGGGVGQMVAHALEAPALGAQYPRWRAMLTGHALAWFFMPLDPVRYAPGIAPRPLLMVNDPEDPIVPRARVLTLYEAARSPKDLIWVKTGHAWPPPPENVHEVSGIITSWLIKYDLLEAL